MAWEVWLHISRQVGESVARSFLKGASQLGLGVVTGNVSPTWAIPYSKTCKVSFDWIGRLLGDTARAGM